MSDAKMQSAIKEINLDDGTFHNITIKPTLINYFFGRNGVGKTTIAQHILKNNGISPNTDNYETLVYDRNFITNNIKEDTSMPGVFTLSKENIDIQNKISKLTTELQELQEQYNQKQSTLNDNTAKYPSLRSTLENLCWTKTNEIRDGFKEALTGKRGRKSQWADELLTIQKPQQFNIEQLKKLYDTAFNKSASTYPLLAEATLQSQEDFPGYDLLAQSIISSADTPFAKFVQAISATDWLKQGHDHFSGQTNGHCPYCHQPLPSDFEEQVASCFDKKYKADIDTLKDFQSSYDNYSSQLVSILANNLSCNFTQIDFSIYKEQLTNLEKTIQHNKELIQSKLEHPSTVIQLQDIFPIAEKLNSQIIDFNKTIQENNDIVASIQEKQNECQKSVWQHMAFMVKNEINAYRTSTANLNKSQKVLTEELSDISKKITAQRKEIATLNSQIINVDLALDSMNKELSDSGFQGFHLEKDRGNSHKYKIIREDGSPAHGLSEGERNFIAFLYFYHKVRGLEDPNSVFKDRIVVIDDPVSSMDSSALFIISSIIREMISICYNNASTPKPDAPRYIKQIFILTHNALFYKEISYNHLKHYHCTNFFLIQKSRNVSTVTLCVHKDINSDCPAIERNYSPVRDAYTTLWKEYKETSSPTVLMRTARQILEYYFIQISGYEGQTLSDRIMKSINSFVETYPDGTENRMKQNHVIALLRYIGEEKPRFNDGLDYIESNDDSKNIRDTFKLIFTLMGQDQHYNMMMATA